LTLKKLIGFLLVLSLCACASSNVGQGKSSLKDQRLSTTFTDEGIKITYTTFGNLESIEVFGQAEAWRGNVEAIAEADAMAKLTKFIYGKDVSTNRVMKVIGQSIEAAADNSLSKYTAGDGSINVTASDIERIASEGNLSGQRNQNDSAQRNALAVNKSLVYTVTTITSKGRLTGIKKVRDFQRSDGKIYVAVYEWNEKNQATSDYLKNRMQSK